MSDSEEGVPNSRPHHPQNRAESTHSCPETGRATPRTPLLGLCMADSRVCVLLSGLYMAPKPGYCKYRRCNSASHTRDIAIWMPYISHLAFPDYPNPPHISELPAASPFKTRLNMPQLPESGKINMLPSNPRGEHAPILKIRQNPPTFVRFRGKFHNSQPPHPQNRQKLPAHQTSGPATGIGDAQQSPQPQPQRHSSVTAFAQLQHRIAAAATVATSSAAPHSSRKRCNNRKRDCSHSCNHRGHSVTQSAG